MHSNTADLFVQQQSGNLASGFDWPSHHRFPLNSCGSQLQNTVFNDLKSSTSPLLVTGFASLDELIEFAYEATGPGAENPPGQIRLLFGAEPFPGRRESYSLSGHTLPAEARQYWLNRGISLFHSAAILHCVELLKSGQIAARYIKGGARLHAKIYCGDKAATLGSSNFTPPGLRFQHEANARFTQKAESKRFAETCQIAENFWVMGTDYRDQLVALLEALLKLVNWREALARACAELLEGEWAAKYLTEDYLSDAGALWPSQQQGIAQALYILSNRGSVLIADATGAGKTRMGTYLMGAVQDDVLRRGRLRKGRAVMVCPPSVEPSWQREATQASMALTIYSQGKLSAKNSRQHDDILESLKRAQLLCVDEGHNFLNVKSNRSQHLLRNIADHVVLLTATPINRGVGDLLRIADLLGADNLDESTLTAFDNMLRAQKVNRSLTHKELDLLRGEIQKFTVRRTKSVLNRLIDRQPDDYRDKDNKRCRFPKHKPVLYDLGEPEGDKRLAAEIAALADRLLAVSYFAKPIELPESLQKQGMQEQQYLDGRLRSAKKMARYQILKALRSSRAALIEHIEGTEKAIEAVRLKSYSRSKPAAGQLSSIAAIRGKPPKNKLRIALPDWLTDQFAHTTACDVDTQLYRQIASKARALSDHREMRKAATIVMLLRSKNLVLAFDSRPITLAHIRQLIARSPSITCLLATGDTGSDRQALLTTFAHGSSATNTVGLCSDSFSEGVNLQQAAALVHLDMPSVVRIAEQRAGRVDRMDSPHASIEVWWPNDAEEFQLSSDDRFVERYETVENLIGGNMPLPETMQTSSAKRLSTQQMLDELERDAEQPWDGISDAFQPVRDLIEGEQALVSPDIYEQYRHERAQVLSRVSLVASKSPWAFFCLNAGGFAAPRWVLLPGYTQDAIVGLPEVAAALRERLTPETEDLNMTRQTAKALGTMLKALSMAERRLLPRKKQRALDEMEAVLAGLMAAPETSNDDHARLKDLRNLLVRPSPERQPDWEEVATRWLDIIRPVWFERLQERRTKPLLLADIRDSLLAQPTAITAAVMREFEDIPQVDGPEKRIRACIIGVGS